MKKTAKKIVSLVMLVTMVWGSGVSAYAAEQSYESQMEQEKVAMLEDVKQQLIAQDGMRFYPIYEKMIEDMFAPATRASQTSLPNGGTIYYKNYVNTGVEMLNTYYSDEAYNALINGDPVPNAFVDMVAALTVGLASKAVGALMAVHSFLTIAENRELKMLVVHIFA